MNARPRAAAGILALAASPAASAHLLATGYGSLVDGFAHFFLSADDLLPAAALALLAGLAGREASRRAILVLPPAWFAGGLAGFVSGATGLPAGITAPSLLVLGLLVAAGRAFPPPAVAMLAAALGLLHGALNGAAIAATGRGAAGLAGIAIAVLLVAALLAPPVARLRAPWARVAVRVAGSWIAAIGLLLLGWALSGRA